MGSTLDITRPMPPAELWEPATLDPASVLFTPAHELREWAYETFIDGTGLLANEEHGHLESASIGYLWTNLRNEKDQAQIVATAELVSPTGKVWVKGRQERQIFDWFGELPNFMITVYAPGAAEWDDARMCAVIEHELLHCYVKLDAYGDPRINPLTNGPIWGMRAHDVEEFVSIVERYGPGASAGKTMQLVEAANRVPLIARADIARACGTCLRMAA